MVRSRGLYSRGFGDDRVQRCRIRICPKLGTEALIPQGSRHKRERLEVFYTCVFGCKQSKDHVHWLTVYRFEIDRFFQKDENAHHGLDPIKPRVGQSDAMAHTSWTKAFAFKKRLDGALCRDSISRLGNIRQVVHQALLAGYTC